MKISPKKQIKAIKMLFSELFRKLVLFALEDEFEEDLEESLAVFYHLQEGEIYEFNPENEFLFLPWFILDDTDANDCGLIDLFIDRMSSQLTSQEIQLCQALKETSLSLFQVVTVSKGKLLRLRDVFLGNEFDVVETLGSEGVSAESLLYARVLHIGEQALIVGAGLFFNSRLLEPLRTFFGDLYRDECKEGEITHFKEFLKGNAEIINWWIRAFERGEVLTKQDIQN